MRNWLFFNSDVFMASSDLAAKLTVDFGHSDQAESLAEAVDDCVQRWFAERFNETRTAAEEASDAD